MPLKSSALSTDAELLGWGTYRGGSRTGNLGTYEAQNTPQWGDSSVGLPEATTKRDAFRALVLSQLQAIASGRDRLRPYDCALCDAPYQQDILTAIHQLHLDLKAQQAATRFAAETLKTSEERHRALANAIPDLMFRLHLDGTFLDFKADAGDELAMPSEAIVGSNIRDSPIPTEVVEKTLGRLHFAVESGTLQDFEYELCVPLGTLHFEARIVASGVDEGMCIVRNVTARKDAERLKDELISTVSHELRTPMTSIHGALQLILGGAAGDTSPRVRELLQTAARNSTRLVRLLNTFLDVEKMMSGSTELKREPIKVRAWLERCLADCQGFAAPRGVQLLLDTPEAGHTMMGDVDRLTQVVANLISNAVKFSEPDTQVVVGATLDGESVGITVRDSGQGIPISFRDQVFCKFSQAKHADGPSDGTSGLGLSICKMIVEQHGGTISFDTELGVGTTFRFHLPAGAREGRSHHPEPPPCQGSHQDASPPEALRARPQRTIKPSTNDPSIAHGSSAPAKDPALEGLYADYTRRMPAKLQALQNEVQTCLLDPKATGPALNSAHKLRGTAGCYGLPEVGAAAGHLEEALLALEACSPAPHAPFVERVRQSMSALAATAGGKVSRPPSEGTRPVPYSPCLLVVDDDEDFTRRVVELTRQKMIEIVICRTEVETLARARRCNPTAALLNVRLGGTSAHQLSTKIRSLPGLQQLPFAFTTPSSALEDYVLCAHHGASLTLAKPIENEVLLAALEQLVASGQAATPRVLIVDDDDDFSRHTEAILRDEGLVVQSLQDPSNILEVLEQFHPDLLVLDMVMPGFSGLDLCRTIRTSRRWQSLPIVFATARDDSATRLAAFEAGGDDYVSKPILKEELLARVKVRVDRSRLLRELDNSDSLSGLMLRRPFIEAVARALSYGRRHARPLAVVLIDLDHFKQVNDTHGHLSGDQVIARFGQLIQQKFRAEDLQGRWGGEEFILAFPGETADTIRDAILRLLGNFRDMTFHDEQGESFTASFTAGVASYPDDGTSFKELVEIADQRLYRGKHLGRNNVISMSDPTFVKSVTAAPSALSAISQPSIAKEPLRGSS